MNQSVDALIAEIAAKTAALPQQRFYTQAAVLKTPLIHSKVLSDLCDADVWLKCENQQQTGSFKYRGAVSALMASTQQQAVIAASSGNHGAAVAKAAQRLGISASIYVPDSISPNKETKILSTGATLHKVAGGCETAEHLARQAAQHQGLRYVSPYNDVDVIAGQGTIASEALAQNPSLNSIYVSVGGGGMISGIGAWCAQHARQVEIIGCWAVHSPVMLRCMQAGAVIDVDEQDTLSDGTAGGLEKNAITLPVCQQVIARTIEVTEHDIALSMALIAKHHQLKLEGAAAVAVASAIADKENIKGKQVAVVLCGQNITAQQFEKAMQIAG